MVPGLGPLIRSFGTLSVRRGESDRDAVRRMREVVRDGNALAVFVEGTRQRSGVPGHVQPGAAMVALQEDVPVVCAAIHGSQHWKPGNFAPVSIAWGEPMRFDGLPRGGKGYREASAQIEAELYRLWAWLRDLHEAGRPRVAVPPGARGRRIGHAFGVSDRELDAVELARAAAASAARRGGDHRLPQRRQVDARQPADRDARRRRARDAGGDA